MDAPAGAIGCPEADIASAWKGPRVDGCSFDDSAVDLQGPLLVMRVTRQLSAVPSHIAVGRKRSSSPTR